MQYRSNTCWFFCKLVWRIDLDRSGAYTKCRECLLLLWQRFRQVWIDTDPQGRPLLNTALCIETSPVFSVKTVDRYFMGVCYFWTFSIYNYITRIFDRLYSMFTKTAIVRRQLPSISLRRVHLWSRVIRAREHELGCRGTSRPLQPNPQTRNCKQANTASYSGSQVFPMERRYMCLCWRLLGLSRAKKKTYVTLCEQFPLCKGLNPSQFRIANLA